MTAALLSITASVMNYFGVKMGYPCLPELDGALKDAAPRVVILMVLDGMGENLLRRRLPENSFFRTHDVCPLSAVFPSTTTAATTSIWSGLSPLEHGWLGWSLYFKECGRQIDTFLNRDSHTGEAYPGPSPAETLMPGSVRLCAPERKGGNARGVPIPQLFHKRSRLRAHLRRPRFRRLRAGRPRGERRAWKEARVRIFLRARSYHA